VRSMFDLMVELSKHLDPSGKYSFWSFESLEPFETVMISAKKSDLLLHTSVRGSAMDAKLRTNLR